MIHKTTDSIQVVKSREIDAPNSYLIVGLPDVGLVRSISIMHIVKAPDLEEVWTLEVGLPKRLTKRREVVT